MISFQFISATLGQCVQTNGYAEPCTATYMCQTQFNLFCQTTASDCDCPTTSVVGSEKLDFELINFRKLIFLFLNRMCDCPNTRFWSVNFY